MSILHATVRGGRLILDEPTDLPEGTTVDLVLIADEPEMTSEERAQLDESIERGLAQADRGEAIPADEFLLRLRPS